MLLWNSRSIVKWRTRRKLFTITGREEEIRLVHSLSYAGILARILLMDGCRYDSGPDKLTGNAEPLCDTKLPVADCSESTAEPTARFPSYSVSRREHAP